MVNTLLRLNLDPTEKLIMNQQNIIDNLNFANDHRNCAQDKQPIVYLELEDGGIEERPLPTVWGICDVCNGEGKHTNPAVDCGGLSYDDFAGDRDFAEDYSSGMYDITCNKCNGRTTIKVVDWENLTPEIRSAYEAQLNEEARDYAEHMAEIRMGA